MMLLLLFWMFLNPAQAASCCGSNISTPALITTGEKYKIQISHSQMAKYFDVGQDRQPILLSCPVPYDRQSFKFGYLIDETYQAFVQTAWQKPNLGDSEGGIGRSLDVNQVDNSFVWISHVWPTGKAIYQLEGSKQMPSGSGHASTAVGLMLGQNYIWGDLGTSLVYSYSHVQEQQGVRVKANDQILFSAGGGRSLNRWRWGVQQSIVYSYDSLYWPTQVTASMLDGARIWNLSYIDESIFGPVQNTSLNRAISLSLILRTFSKD